MFLKDERNKIVIDLNKDNPPQKEKFSLSGKIKNNSQKN